MAYMSCSICIKQEKTSYPAVYCHQCSELMCQSCSDTHNQSEETKNHEVLKYHDYQKLPPLILKTNLYCSQHGHKFEDYCRMDDELCCKECKTIFHSKCKDVPKIEDIVYNVKTSVLFTDTFSEIKHLFKTLREVSEDRNKNIRHLKRRHKDITRTVENKFNNIIDHLIKLKVRKICEIDNVYAELTNNLSTTSQMIYSEANILNKILDQKDDITKHATNYQTFIALKETEKVVQETNLKLKELSDINTLMQFNMEFEINETVADIHSSIQSFGDLKVTETPSDVSIRTTRARYLEAIKKVPTPAPVQLNLQKTIDRHFGGRYSSCCILPANELLVVVDYDTKTFNIHIYKSDGSIRSTIKLNKSEKVWAVAPVNDHHFAVSHPTAGTLSIIDVNKGFFKKGKVVRTLYIKKGVYGLCCNGREIVCCVEKYGLVKVNIDSKEMETVVTDWSVGYDSYVDVSNSFICYTCLLKNAITVLNSNYNVIYTYKDELVLTWPTGVVADDHKNIYVTGWGSNNLVIISSDGKICHQLLSEGDGLKQPVAVYYDSSTKKLVVVNEKGPVFIYFVEKYEIDQLLL